MTKAEEAKLVQKKRRSTQSCPYCKGETLIPYDTELTLKAVPDELVRKLQCYDCGNTFTDVYKVVYRHTVLADAKDLRHCLEGLPCPICTGGYTDEQLYELYKELDDIMQANFGSTYKTNTELEDKIQAAWWKYLEELALERGMQYYEDLD